MKPVFKLIIILPDNICEEYIMQSFPHYLVGQTILFDHRSSRNKNDNLEKFEIEEIFHEIKSILTNELIIEFSMSLYMKKID